MPTKWIIIVARHNHLCFPLPQTETNNFKNTNIVHIYCIKKQRYPATGRGGPRGSGYVKAPDILDFRHYKGARSSAKRTGRLYPRRSPSEAESTSGYMVLSEGTTEKNPK